MTDYSKTTAVVLHGIDDIRFEERPGPVPKPHEVVIAIKTVGICGSDVHYWTHGRIGDFIVKAPMVLGHESSGLIVGVGSSVSHLKVGDRVTMEPGVPCGSCEFCKIGRYNLCHDMVFWATPPYDGSLSNFVTHSAAFCYKLPDNVSYDEAACCEPLSVGVHACTRAGVTIGSRVLILGAGPIGLVNILVAKAAGASSVVVVDMQQNRLEVAKKVGANATFLATQDIIAEIAKGGWGPIDVTIECSGAERAIQSAIRATKSGGVVVLVGMGPPEIKVPLIDAAVREVDIRGIFRYANCYPKALALIASGQCDVKPLITHRFKFEDTIKAFELSKTMADNAIKVTIQLNPNL